MKEPSANPSKTFMAIALCVLFYLGYNQYLTHKYPHLYDKSKTTSAPASATATSTPHVSSQPSEPTEPVAQPITQLPESDLVFDNSLFRAQFAQDSAAIKSFTLKNFQESVGKDSTNIELVKSPTPLQAFVGTAPLAPLRGVFNAERSGQTLRFWREAAPWRIEQIYSFPENSYQFDLTVKLTNLTAATQDLKAGLFTQFDIPLRDGNAPPATILPTGGVTHKPRFVSQVQGSENFVDVEKFCNDSHVESGQDRALDFIGFDTHYFLTAFTPKENFDYYAEKSRAAASTAGVCTITLSLAKPALQVQPNQSIEYSFKSYFGPKDVDLLTEVNAKLKSTVGLGWLDMIAHPLLLAIKGFYKYLGNYGLAIILLTLLLKVLFYPLTRKAAESTVKMKKYNPQMAEIREKYKGDQMRIQQEMMKFMQTHQINPMKGCLPILPQIPVFFALFRVLSASIELRHAPFYGWIQDLSVHDPYYITPIILGGLMFVQQKMTPMTGMDKTQEKIMLFMPILFTVMMLTLPSGLVLYMLTNTLTSILQQQWLNKKLMANA
jgi:YidC/Oxa1 family membrane protein insertase